MPTKPLSTAKRHRFPAIPSDPVDPNNPRRLAQVVDAMRERLQIMTRDRGDVGDSFVSVQELVDLGVLTEAQAESLRRDR